MGSATDSTVNMLQVSTQNRDVKVHLSGLQQSALQALQRLQDAARRLWSHHLREKAQDAWDLVLDTYDEVCWHLETFRFRHLYDRFVFFLTTEVTRTSLFVGCIGFAVGGLFGLYVGFALRRRAAITPRMKAVVCNGYQGLDAVTLIDDMPLPQIVDPDQVLIQVKAASVDIVDLRICTGYCRALRRIVSWGQEGEFPVVLGREAAGVVLETGQEVRRLEVGDEVWLCTSVFASGLMAEFVVAKERHVARKPRHLSFEVAATLPYTVALAWSHLVGRGKIRPYSARGKRVLIYGSGSAVGCTAIQLVKAWGGHVTATASTRALPVVQTLGADDVLLHTLPATGIELELAAKEKFDLVLNTNDPVHRDDSAISLLRFCKPRGMVVTTSPPPLASDDFGFPLSILNSLWIRLRCLLQKVDNWEEYALKTEALEEASKLAEQGLLQPILDKSYSATDAELAFQHAAVAGAVGKTVLWFRPSSFPS